MDAIIFWRAFKTKSAVGAKVKRILSITAIALLLAFSGPLETRSAVHCEVAITVSTEKYLRTELYFGLSKPDGSQVTDPEWQKFVNEFVTPRFPDGLTEIDANGQWRGKDGNFVREKSRILILLYSRKDRKATGAKIEEICTEYKKRFNQESVLRLDFTKSVNVTF